MKKNWRLEKTKQCSKCPWRVGVDPRDIPNGYSIEKHQALMSTIAIPGDLNLGQLDVMACHETHSAHCIGWLNHQLGRGNNIGLRLQMLTCQNIAEIEVIGDQHSNFDDTLPQS